MRTSLTRRVSRHSWPVGLLIAVIMATAAALTTDPHAPPRFDGAGYAVLGEALATGRGYREIDHPDAPRHAHFPPGYPAALSVLWKFAGRSAPAGHAFSVACATAAAVAAWRWFGGMYGPRVAGLLGLALAVNWTWARAGGAIQSEPMFLLLSQLALLGATRAVGVRAGAALGGLLGACVLTRHVGLALAAAVVGELVLRGRVRAALAASLTGLAVLTPWVVWLASVGRDTQAGLVSRSGLLPRLASQAVFYVRRIPDQLDGPIVEIATVFRGPGPVAWTANLGAALATGLIVFGWVRAVRTPRRRLAGSTAFVTLALLLVWPFTEAGRFLIPLVPCLLVGAVEGLAALGPIARAGRPRVVASALVLAASLPYPVYAVITDRAGAQRRSHEPFDVACGWIARNASRPGPVLTRHPGEVYWQTGRHAVAPPSDPAAVARAVDRLGVAYLLVDDARYADAPESPLAAYAAADPDRVRSVWKAEARPGGPSVVVYEVVR